MDALYQLSLSSIYCHIFLLRNNSFDIVNLFVKTLIYVVRPIKMYQVQISSFKKYGRIVLNIKRWQHTDRSTRISLNKLHGVERREKSSQQFLSHQREGHHEKNTTNKSSITSWRNQSLYRNTIRACFLFELDTTTRYHFSDGEMMWRICHTINVSIQSQGKRNDSS